MSRLDKLLKLLEADPNDAFVLYGIAQEHAGRGDAAGHEAALGFYDRCVRADPSYCYAYYHKAASLVELGRTEEARGTLRSGMEAAKRASDGKALGEMTALLDTL